MIARVFPRRTKATPMDNLVFFGDPPELLKEGITEAHVSVAFTWDIPKANFLFEKWSKFVETKIGGPALGTRGEEFEPGRYLREGYTITSRGCPNRCWFCSTWRRDGNIRELPIREGWNVQDDNLLACSDSHIRAVFAMLKKQKKKAEFKGGIEAKRLKPWHVDLFLDLKPAQIFFAYDTEDDKQPLEMAIKMMQDAGFSRNVLRCYVLIGYPKDIIRSAIKRLRFVRGLGACPMAMLYRNPKDGIQKKVWENLQRLWARPGIIYGKKSGRINHAMGLFVKE